MVKITNWCKVLVPLICLISINATSVANSELDETLLGVNEGDQFSFSVERFADLNRDNDGYFLGYDIFESEEHFIREGEVFAISFPSTELYGPSESGHYHVKFVISYGNQTFESINHLNVFSGYIASIDWDGQNSFLENWIQSINSSQFDSFNANIIDTSMEFGMEMEYSGSSEEITLYNERERRYEKKTGILIYERIYNEYNNSGFWDHYEAIVKRKDWGVSKGLYIPEIAKYTFAVFLILIIILLLVKNRKLEIN